MAQSATLPAPGLPRPPEDKWRREQRAFQRLLADLLKTHRGQYVAIHDEQMVANGADKLDVAGRAYARFGYVPIFVGLVTDQPPAPIRMPTPRLLPTEKRS
jgi:hypothetical protein